MNAPYVHLIEFYTNSLVITGAYDLSIYRRMSDAINGEQRQYIPLRDATIAPLERAQQAQRVPYLLVARNDVLLATTISEATPPSDYPREEQMRGVVPISAMFFTSAFVVRATFHKRPDLTLTEALERINDDFVPLRSIQVFPLLAAFPPLNRDFAALARSQIVALYQLAEPPPEEPPEDPPAPSPEEPPGEPQAPEPPEE